MDYCVTGAGTAGVDGGYTESGGHPGQYFHDGGTDFRLVNTGYYEIRSGANPYVVPATTDTGYYYDSAGGGGSYEGIDTINTGGTAPVPTVTAGSCQENLVFATSTATTQDVVFGLAIIITLLSFMLVAFIFNSIKKPWR